MIAGMMMNSESERVVKVFERMVDEGVFPDLELFDLWVSINKGVCGSF